MVEEKVLIHGIDSRGWSCAPPSEVSTYLANKGYKYVASSTTVDVSPADVTVITAIIGSGAGIISTAITAAMIYISKRKEGTIIIHGASGRKIEVPAGTSEEDIDVYLQKAKEIDVTEITIMDDPHIFEKL
jgi:ABC-type transporter Mla maintaining outer membrane lipid asymmetry ATPase subunit MlaF